MPPPRLRSYFQQSRKGVAAFCLFLFLVLQAMAVFPALHAIIHHDANDPSHQCAVTLFLHGQVHASGAAVPPAQPARVFATELSFVSADFSSAEFQLLPCRGPPDFRSLL